MGDNRGNLNLIIALLFVVALGLGVGLSYLSSHPYQDFGLLAESTPGPEILETPAPELDGEVSFDPPEEFSEGLQQAIYARILDPYREFFSYSGEGGPVVSMHVERGTEGDSLTPYQVRVLHSTGKTAIVPIGMLADSVAWWQPICDTLCLFSDSFVEKYPEIVQNTTQ